MTVTSWIVERPRVRRSAGAALALCLGGLAAVDARAQPVERNLPPAPQAPNTVIAAPPLPGSIEDDNALGANLSAIVILGSTSPWASSFQRPA